MKIVEFKDYDNQTTPLSAYNLNRLQQNLITTKYQMTFSSAVSGGSTITLPCYYQVGQDTLDVYLNSELLKKASTKDSEGHYYEVGNSDTKSNQIKITSDWSIASGDVLNLIVRGTTDSYDQNLSPDKATQLADEISANKEEITNLKNENSYLQNVVKQAFKETSANGTELTIDNTIEARMDLKLKGNTSQQQYSGKNLVKLYETNKGITDSGLSYDLDDDGKLSIKGTTNRPWDYTISKPIDFEVGKTYTFSVIFLNIANNTTPPVLYLLLSANNGGQKGISKFSTSITFTIKELQKIPIMCSMSKNLNVDFSLKLQIEEGSTATDYEPYTGGIASPNPDYPQEIHCVKGNNVVKISNGTEETEYKLNLGNIELNVIDNYKDYFKKENGKWYKVENIGSYTFEGNENFSFTDVGTINQRFDIRISTLNIDCLPDQEYKLFTHFRNKLNNDGIWGEYYMTSNWLVIKDNDSKMTSLEDFKAWLSANKPTIYYVKTSASDIEITDTTLINQLNEISQALSKKGTTIISQNNDDLPFNLDVIALTK